MPSNMVVFSRALLNSPSWPRAFWPVSLSSPVRQNGWKSYSGHFQSFVVRKGGNGPWPAAAIAPQILRDLHKCGCGLLPGMGETHILYSDFLSTQGKVPLALWHR